MAKAKTEGQKFKKGEAVTFPLGNSMINAKVEEVLEGGKYKLRTEGGKVVTRTDKSISKAA